MSKKRRRFTSKFKAKVAMEAINDRYTVSELADRHGVHPNQISQWKRHFLENADLAFKKGTKEKDDSEYEKDELLKMIGQLKVENEFLKKKLG